MTQVSAPAIVENMHPYLVGELSPLKKQLFEFWGEVGSVKVGIKEALYGKRLSRLTDRHQELMNQWRGIRQKAVDLDAFIQHDDPRLHEKIGEWLGNPVYRETVEREERAVSAVMRDITDNLRELRIEADFKRSGFLSVSAIVIGVGSLVTTLLLNLL